MSSQCPCLPVRSAKKKKTSKTTFLTFKHDENPHGVPDGPEFDAGIFEISRGCLQVVEPPTLLFNQFVVPVCSANDTKSKTLLSTFKMVWKTSWSTW
jgi:hypothetical protein